LGLNHFATLSTGEKITNPRWARRAEHELSAAHRQVSRKPKGSRNRRRAVRGLRRIYERVHARRRDFCHQESRRLVSRFDLIAFEKLNVKGMSRTRMGKSILDAAWGMFLSMLTRKAENAGRHAVAVDARFTSQTCPSCGVVKKKDLSERIHDCECGLILDRDHASAMIVEARGLRVVGSLVAEESPLPPHPSAVASESVEARSLA